MIVCSSALFPLFTTALRFVNTQHIFLISLALPTLRGVKIGCLGRVSVDRKQHTLKYESFMSSVGETVYSSISNFIIGG